MTEIVEIDWLTAYNKLQTFHILVLDCRSRDEWDKDHLIRSLPCPVTLADVEAGISILELVQENISDFPVLARRAERGRLETKMLYGNSESMALVGNLLSKWNPSSKIFLVTPDEITRLKEETAFCFSNIDLLEKRMSVQAMGRKSHPNLILKEGLWLGAAVQAMNRKIVEDLGVSHILNATKGCPSQFENDHELGLEYIRISIEDHTDANLLTQIPTAIAFIKKGLEKGNGVLVHCMCGISRSVSLVMAYLVSEKEMSLKQAFDHVKGLRPLACPNTGFIEQLGEFEMKLRGSTTYREVYDISWNRHKDDQAKSVKNLFDQNRCCELL